MTKFFTGDLTTLDANGNNGLCPHCNINHIDNGTYEHNPSDGYKCEEMTYCCMGCNGEWGPLLRKRKGVSHAGKVGKREKVSVKAWLKANPNATYEQALAYVKSTGRSEITLKIQAKNVGHTFPGRPPYSWE